MITDDKTAIVSPWEFQQLPEYSTSLPTGTTIGKTWKRALMRALPPDPMSSFPRAEPTGEWSLGEYVPHPEPGQVGIKWRALLVVAGCSCCR